MDKYEVVIGLEVHAELLTRSKMFCPCSAQWFGAEPNTLTCPVCTGMPGALPVVNRTAVEYAVMAALALNCQITETSVFSRKNYFYPDLPKAYQISMYDLPISQHGWLDINVDGHQKRIGITRVHLEEDTAKLTHVDGYSLVDFNRSGVPLMEIVSEPDLRSVEEVHLYSLKLRQILRYLGVSSGDMEKGAMRFEANISLRPKGSTEYGTRTEIKNLNSFRAMLRALEYEIERQARVLAGGGTVEQETMGWDEARGVTVTQRGKEYADDYRYFPEPDLPPLVMTAEWLEDLRRRIPELPEARRDRLLTEYGLSSYDAEVLTGERAVADYFEACVALYPEAKEVSNWITGELFRLLKATGTDIEESKISPERLVELLRLVDDGTVNRNVAKTILGDMFESGQAAADIVARRGLTQISDAERLESIIGEVLAANEKAVADYLGGKQGTIGFLMGQVMKATRGQANPALVNELLRNKLKAL